MHIYMYDIDLLNKLSDYLVGQNTCVYYTAGICSTGMTYQEWLAGSVR